MLPASRSALAGTVREKPVGLFVCGGAVGFASAMREKNDGFTDVPGGARSAAGRMTALSLMRNVRGH
jgi:hypothetical protein